MIDYTKGRTRMGGRWKAHSWRPMDRPRSHPPFSSSPTQRPPMTTLREALERLSFAAQTTGGVAGPDPELMAAIEQAAQALAAAPKPGDASEQG